MKNHFSIIAQLFMCASGDRIFFNEGVWYFYEDSYYKKDIDNTITFNMVANNLEYLTTISTYHLDITYESINDIIKCMQRHQLYNIPSSRINTCNDLPNSQCFNYDIGIVDVTLGKIYPHSRKYFFTYCAKAKTALDLSMHYQSDEYILNLFKNRLLNNNKRIIHIGKKEQSYSRGIW